MKKLLISLISFFFYCMVANAQMAKDTVPGVKRHVPISYIGKDSVNLALNDIFDRIEDSCSLVIRYAHLNKASHKFFGKFKDVSVEDTSLVLTEGNYNNSGQKDGYFIAHNLSGMLQAKGNFKNDQYDGKWEVYYDDGKPRLFFEANGSDIKITDAWDIKGVKVVDNGKGTYRVDLGKIYWEGKLLNGKPDGTWSVIKTADVTRTDWGTEKYKTEFFKKAVDR